MPDISKITLPSGNTYDIKDAVARQAIAGGIGFVIVWTQTDWASSTAPDAAKLATIPKDVTVHYNSGANTAVGTLEASESTIGNFYLIYSTTQIGSKDMYNEYVTVSNSGFFWEKIGDTEVDLTGVVTDVSINPTGHTDTVIGTDATFTITQPTITLAEDSSTGVTFVRGGTTKYMKATASGAAVTPTTTNIKATASGGGAAWNSKDSKTVVTGYASPTSDTFVKSVSAETNKKMVTTTVPNVTAAGSASTWSFAMGTGSGNTETLVISGGNSTAPTLGTAITVATGATDAAGTGDAVVTGVTVGDSASALTGLGSPSTATVIGSSSTFTNTQPTVALATGATAGTGVISVATGITSVTQPTVTLSNDGVSGTNVAYVESVDTSKKMKGTASGANTAWNNKDSVTVLKSDTTLNVTKGTNSGE